MNNREDWTTESNIEESYEETESTNLHHQINMEVRDLYRFCESQDIPVFIAYYLPGKGYKYRAAFPEEIGTEDVQSEFGKFKEFLKVCIEFNKNDYFPQIH